MQISFHHPSNYLDFCTGGEEATPGGTLLGIMQQNGYNVTDIEYRIALFYINVSVCVNKPIAILHLLTPIGI